MKSTVGYIWPFEDRCQLIYYQQPFWLLCICICLPVFLIQSNLDTGQAIHLVQIEIDSVEVYNQYFATFVFHVHAQ